MLVSLFHLILSNNTMFLFCLENLKENIEHLENQNLTLKLNLETKDAMNSKVDYSKIYKFIN